MHGLLIIMVVLRVVPHVIHQLNENSQSETTGEFIDNTNKID